MLARARQIFRSIDFSIVKTPFTRHFPFGFRLEPIQARNVSYSNNLRLPHVDSSSYSCLRPRFQGSYTWNMLL